MPRRTIWAVLLAPLLLSGCVSAGKIVSALAQDPATAHVTIRSIYFTIEVDRTNPLTNTLPHSVADGKITVGGVKE